MTRIKANKKLIIIIIAAVIAAVLAASAITAAVLLSRPGEQEIYKITFISRNGEDIDPIYTSGNRALSLPKPLREGYSFEGWFFDDGTFAEPLLRDTFRDKTLNGNITVYAKWVFTGYTIIFDTGEDGDKNSVIVGQGGIVSPPLQPNKQGYSFWGWFIDKGLSVPYDFTAEVIGNLTLYAKWLMQDGQRIFTVTFDSLSDISIPPIDVLEGETAALPTPSAEGYDFGGWFIDPALSMPYPIANEVAADIKLFAKWTPNPAEFTVKFEANGGAPVSDITVKINAVIQPPAVERAGYDFVGWYRDAELIFPFNFEAAITANTILYAKWEKRPEPIIRFDIYYNNFYRDGGAREITAAKGSLISDLAPETREGFVFGGWFTASGQAYNFLLPLEGTLELYAKWDPSGEYKEGGLTYKLSPDRLYYTVTAYAPETGSPSIADSLAGLPVKAVEDGVFRNKHIESIKLPQSLERIGSEAFFKSGSLTEVVIPESVVYIGANAFAYNEYLQKIEVKGTPQIESYAFARNTRLSQIILSSELTDIAEYMLLGSVNLTRFVFPEAVTVVPKGFLEGATKLHEVVLSQNIHQIGAAAFKNCGTLSAIDLKNTQTIGNEAFYKSGLTSLILTASVRAAGSQAFGYCVNLRSVHIGKGFENIGYSFLGSPIESYAADEENPYFSSSEDGSLYSKDKKSLIRFAAYHLREARVEFTVPQGVERIESGAFAQANGLKKLILSTTVKDIDPFAVMQTASLEEIEAGSEYFSSQDGVLYDKNKTILIKYPQNKQADKFVLPDSVREVAEAAFAGAAIKEIDLGADLQKIGTRAFAASELTRITIPMSVTDLGQEAFADCVSLVSITFTANVSVLPSGLFRGAVSLTDVYFFSSPAGTGNAFAGCVGITSVSVYDSSGVIDFSAFASKPLLRVKGANLFEEYKRKYQGAGIFSDISVF